MFTALELARQISLMLIVVFTISACDNGTADPSADIGEMNTVPIQRIGRVWIVQLNDGSRGTSIEAAFGLFNRPLGGERNIDTALPSPDLCTTDTLSPTGLGAAFINEQDSSLDVEYISAGEALVFSSPVGTWHTVLQDPGADDFGYVDRAPPPPDDLLLDIPGDSFPSFADMPVANITPLEIVTPGYLSTLDSDTVFRWQPTPTDADADAVIFIEIDVLSESIDPGRRRFLCVAWDDGELALRDAADAELRSLIDQDATLTRLDAGRSGYTTRQTDDALLVVTHSVPQSDPQP